MAETTQPGSRRWLGVTGLGLGVFVTVLDTTILTVAIPTLMKDLTASLSAIQWVVAGYALVFASLLVICGRIGDMIGHRKIVIAGLAVFGIGSLVAALAQNIQTLFVGDAVIEGIGAAMLSASSTGLVSSTFDGRERGAAFGLFGGLAGIAGAFGPVIGGWLTTDASWRWAFSINVVLVPILIVLVIAGISGTHTKGRRERLDISGAVTLTLALFMLVFGIIEGTNYGWWTPAKPFMLGSVQLNPAGVSIVPISVGLALVLFLFFILIERHKDKAGMQPLYPFSKLRFRSYHFGMVSTGALAAGEFTMFIVLSIVLQARQLTALETGLWILPFGLVAIVGAGVGIGLSRKLGAKRTVAIGMGLEVIGLVWVAAFIGPDVTLVSLIPAIATYGLGMGFATAQLGNVTLAEIPAPIAGVASGVNNTVRQVGSALGIAAVGSALTDAGPGTAVLIAAACVFIGFLASLRIPASRAPRPMDAMPAA